MGRECPAHYTRKDNRIMPANLDETEWEKVRTTAPIGQRKPAKTVRPRRQTKVQPKRVMKVASVLKMSPGMVETVVNEYLNGNR